MGEIEEYLQQVTSFFKPPMVPIERFLLKHGTYHTPAPLPKGILRGVPKACYHNASVLAKRRRNLRYAEGMVYRTGLIPLHHGWCLDEQGKVVDPTLVDPEMCEYFGIIVPMEQVKAWYIKHKFYGVLDTPWGPNVEFMQEWEANAAHRNATSGP
jgi:hypothetical protein